MNIRKHKFDKAQIARTFEAQFSPSSAFIIVVALMLGLAVLVTDMVDLTIADVKTQEIEGRGIKNVGTSSLAARKNIPLYGDKPIAKALSESINESIFVTDEKPVNKVIIKPITPEKKRAFDWIRATKESLVLNGISTRHNAAYINGKRFTVGDKIVGFPILGNARNETATLRKVTKEFATVVVADQAVNLKLKDS